MTFASNQNLLRDTRYIKEAISLIEGLEIKRQINIMEVCGTHTQTFFRFGLRALLPASINLISGPGCPVCITEDRFIDEALYLCKDADTVIATFGDLIRVKGSRSSLEDARAQGAQILVVYSPSEALDWAKANPKKRVIFLGVGFETTSPLTALVVKEASRLSLKNFFVLSNHRLIPPALEALCRDKAMTVEGFLCPGHVSIVLGEKPYLRVAGVYKKACVICGFEPLDMLISIYMLLVQIQQTKPKVENQYSRVVKPGGNPLARKVLKEVFETCDASWRGLGIIKKSGLKLKSAYRNFDARRLITGKLPAVGKKNNGCLCAEVIKGKISPLACPKFRLICSPETPLGPCMISSEGSCRIYYEYGPAHGRKSGRVNGKK